MSEKLSLAWNRIKNLAGKAALDCRAGFDRLCDLASQRFAKGEPRQDQRSVLRSRFDGAETKDQLSAESRAALRGRFGTPDAADRSKEEAAREAELMDQISAESRAALRGRFGADGPVLRTKKQEPSQTEALLPDAGDAETRAALRARFAGKEPVLRNKKDPAKDAADRETLHNRFAGAETKEEQDAQARARISAALLAKDQRAQEHGLRARLKAVFARVQKQGWRTAPLGLVKPPRGAGKNTHRRDVKILTVLKNQALSAIRSVRAFPRSCWARLCALALRAKAAVVAFSLKIWEKIKVLAKKVAAWALSVWQKTLALYRRLAAWLGRVRDWINNTEFVRFYRRKQVLIDRLALTGVSFSLLLASVFVGIAFAWTSGPNNIVRETGGNAAISSAVNDGEILGYDAYKYDKNNNIGIRLSHSAAPIELNEYDKIFPQYNEFNPVILRAMVHGYDGSNLTLKLSGEATSFVSTDGKHYISNVINARAALFPGLTDEAESKAVSQGAAIGEDYVYSEAVRRFKAIEAGTIGSEGTPIEINQFVKTNTTPVGKDKDIYIRVGNVQDNMMDSGDRLFVYVMIDYDPALVNLYLKTNTLTYSLSSNERLQFQEAFTFVLSDEN